LYVPCHLHDRLPHTRIYMPKTTVLAEKIGCSFELFPFLSVPLDHHFMEKTLYNHVGNYEINLKSSLFP
jgi:hypothetical protein